MLACSCRRASWLVAVALAGCDTSLPVLSFAAADLAAPVDLGVAIDEGLPADSGVHQCQVEPLVVLPPADSDRPVGAPCALGSQCASGGCSADAAAGGCGVCLDVRPLGARCDGPLSGCSASASCRGGLCLSNKKTVGEPCALAPKGDDLDHECDDDLYCAGAPGMNGTCAERLPPGSPCQRSKTECARGETCDGTRCYPFRAAALGEPCRSRFCQPGLYCSWQTGLCAPGLFCSGSPESRCVDLAAQCEVCDHNRCAPGLFCMEEDDHSYGVYPLRCEHLRREGEPCRIDNFWNIDCQPDLDCRAGVCRKACT